MKRVFEYLKQLCLWNMKRDKVDPIYERIRVRSVADKRMMNKCRKILEYVGYRGKRCIFEETYAQPKALLQVASFGRQSVRMMAVILKETGDAPTPAWERASKWAYREPVDASSKSTSDIVLQDARCNDETTASLFTDASLSNSMDGGKKYE